MTKEQIEKKAKEIAGKMIELANYSSFNTPDEQRNVIASTAKESALRMADWVLSHQWVSVKEAMPPQMGRYSKYVIMLNRVGGHYIGCYDFVAKKWLDGRLEDILYMDVTHWMPIPPLSEEGGEK